MPSGHSSLRLRVGGADLMDGTPIYDIKPYLPYADCHPGARAGFTDTHEIKRLKVVIPEEIKGAEGLGAHEDRGALEGQVAPMDWAALEECLALDPRPRYHDDPLKVYGMPFMGCDVRFKVEGEVLTVLEILPDINQGAGEKVQNSVKLS